MTILVVGNRSDLHIQAVVAAIVLQGSPEPTLLDATTLENQFFALTTENLQYQDSVFSLSEAGRGWLRRYAPSGWGMGVVAGSMEAAIHRSFLALVGSISRMGCREWLTRIDEMLRAEDRLVQLEVAAALSIEVPKSIVTSDARRAVERLGTEFVVKPITIGYFSTQNGPMAVYTNVLTADEASTLDFGGVPFVAQELVKAESHYRIVTVLNNAWVAKLNADGRPIDWRQQVHAHYEWKVTSDDVCAGQAIELARKFGLGFSSQDWLVRGSERIFIDLNPGGQWLFLPKLISSDVTNSIARFLIGS